MAPLARSARAAALLAALAMSSGALAQVAAAPAIVNFQGRLTTPTGTPVPDGNDYSVTVSLWDAATGGAQKWTQTLTNVTVKGGLFSALLTPNSAGLFNGADLWLQVKVGSDPAMTPRQQIASVPFALKANAVPDASITAAQLAPDAASLGKVSNSLLSASGAGVTISGSLGVGTATPAEKLDVRSGKIVLTTAAGQPRAYVAINDSNDTGYMQILSSAGKVVAGFGADDNGGHGFVSDASGNIAVFLLPSGDILARNLYPSGNINAHDVYLDGTVRIYDAAQNNTITLDPSGEITAKVVTVTGGSDVAEPYHVAAAGGVEPRPGMVVAMDPEHVGQMRVSTRAYDRAVGGILSGANGIAPGITLRQRGTVADGAFPVASVGRVWCYADADVNGPITTGTLLTTSDTPGYAMRVTDAARANGAVVGKAMSSLAGGKGLVLVLVSLR